MNIFKKLFGKRAQQPPLEESKGAKKLPPIVHGPQGQEFVLIPAGTFLMGSTEEDLNQVAARWGNPDIIQKANLHLEMPQHEVHLPTYYIGKYPITNEEWQAFMDAGGYQKEAYWPLPEALHTLKKKAPYYWPNPTWREPDHPVVGIDWHQCVAYCNWLSEVMERPVRLLSEAEWEKAASWDEENKKKRQFPWGDEWDASRCHNAEYGIKGTVSVKKYSPTGDSAYGIADLGGNVSEYCSTYFFDVEASKEYHYPYQPDDGREKLSFTPRGHLNSLHIIRGGSWAQLWAGCRCTYRPTVERGVNNNSFGVRIGFSA